MQKRAASLNAIWLRNAAPQPEERSERGRVIVGYSTLVASRTVLVADLIREQSPERGQMASIAEIGLRRELARETTLAAGVGAGHGSGAPRWRLIAGLQQSF